MSLRRLKVKDILVGNGSFDTLIQDGYLYVDKTEYLYTLIRKTGGYYFLSRPRRFGKSLTLSTLEAVFKGKRELFKGLYIDSTDYDWKEYPVIHINFSDIVFKSADELESKIRITLLRIARQYNISIDEQYAYDDVLKSLIEELNKKEKVVILIDEYDSPLTNNINSDKLEEIRTVLRGFYSVIKAADAYIRLCFITGVTKFSKVSIFSAMNNLSDISMKDEYSSMLGYTQAELEECFAEYIDRSASLYGTSREEFLLEIKNWYDGYRFSPKGESVYNPVSVGSFFGDNSEVFSSYWIDTGGMSYFLTEIAQKVHFDISQESELKVASYTLSGVDLIQMVKTQVSRENFLSLLYQSGYLTIKSSSKRRSGYLLTMGYPNEEVEQGLNEILLPAYVGSAARNFDKLILLDLFEGGEVKKAMEKLSSIFASIPYYELVFDSESAWHAGFICMMNILEADIISEAATNKGRIDCVLKCPALIYVIEFKFNQSADEAIAQIKEMRYYEPYIKERKPIHLLGINFSTTEKNIVEWKEETLDI